MDINVVKENLQKNFKCQLVNIIEYANKQFVKGIETFEGGISYRYFKITKENNVEEILDEVLLAYFRKNNETNEVVEY